MIFCMQVLSVPVIINSNVSQECDSLATIMWDHQVGFTTTYAISGYHHKSCKFQSHSWRGVLNTTLHDKICQQQVGGAFQVLGFPQQIKLTAFKIQMKCKEMKITHHVLWNKSDFNGINLVPAWQ
jgi:hypothetical protein